MIKRHFSGFRLLGLACMLFTACNADLFIERDLWAEGEPSLTLDGEGGEATLRIPMKQLEHIRFDVFGAAQSPVSYYDHAGNEIAADSPVSEIARIVYEGNRTFFELRIDDGSLSILSHENISSTDWHTTLALEYSWCTRRIDLTLRPGRGPELVDAGYEIDGEGGIKIETGSETRTFRERFTNDGPIPQSVEVYPWLHVQSEHHGLVTPESSWMNYTKLRFPVLAWDGEEWNIEPMDDVRLGDKYNIPFPQLLDKESVEVPAGATVEIVSTVTLTTARAKGTMRLRRPVSGREDIFAFRCEAVYPANCQIKVENVGS